MFGSTPYTPRFIPGRSLVPPSPSISFSRPYAQRTLTLNEELQLSHSRPLALALPPLLTHLDRTHLSLCLTVGSIIELLTEHHGVGIREYDPGLALIAILGDVGDVGLRLSWMLDEGTVVAKAGWELAKAVKSGRAVEAENAGRVYFGKKKEWQGRFVSVDEAVVRLVTEVDAGTSSILDGIAGESSTYHPLLTQLSTALSILEALLHELPSLIALDSPAKWAAISPHDALALRRREVDWRALVDHLEPLGRTMRDEAMSLVKLAYRKRMYDRAQLEHVRRAFEGEPRWEVDIGERQELAVRSRASQSSRAEGGRDVERELDERRRVEEWARATGVEEDPYGAQSPRSGRREHGVV